MVLRWVMYALCPVITLATMRAADGTKAVRSPVGKIDVVVRSIAGGIRLRLFTRTLFETFDSV